MGIPVPKPFYRRRVPKRKHVNNFTSNIRNRILEEFDNTCQGCWQYGGLHIHHIKPKGSSGRAVFTNGIPLCFVCHTKTHADPKLLQKWQAWAEERYGRYYHMWKEDIITTFTAEDEGFQENFDKWKLYNEG